MSLTTTETESGIEMVFTPDVELVSSIRLFVGELAVKAKLGPEWVSQLELATHELVENAVKSARGKVRMRVELKRDGGALAIELRTWNTASTVNLALLRKAVGECAAAKDPEQYYIELIRRTAGLSGSGLGIGRVAAEAGMSVALEVNGDEACVVARARLPEAP